MKRGNLYAILVGKLQSLALKAQDERCRKAQLHVVKGRIVTEITREIEHHRYKVFMTQRVPFDR